MAPSDDRGQTVGDTKAFASGGSADVGVTAGRIIGGRYEVRHLLGRGGMGVVFAAYDHALRELVAVKVLRPELAAERCWVERLAREVKLARQVQHPNVCRVFDFVHVDGLALVVMELAQESLRAAHERAPRERSLDDRLRDAAGIMAGLAAIHASGIVHRDVTVANVLRLADGRVALTDFGLATGADSTTASVHGGTVAYMAPELTLGVRASFASDVWALGVVLHEVVFGDRPTWHRTSHHHELAVPPRRLTSSERAIFATCRRCLSLDPSARPQNGGAVEKMYFGGRSKRWRGRPLSRPVLFWTSVFLASAGILTAVWNPPSGSSRTEAASFVTREPRPIILTGTPEDWTERSRVLMTVNGVVSGLANLPDRHSVRFVWGSPRRAEDLDVVTGKHAVAPIVQKSYEEGCPDLSADGRSLIYQGYDESGQPHVFKSDNPDGSHALPIISSVMLSTTSEPRWLGKDAIVYNPDDGHVAVFEVSSGRTVIIPGDPGAAGGPAGWKIIDEEESILTGTQEDEGYRLRVLTWPHLRIKRSFTTPGTPTDCLVHSSVTYCSDMQEGVLFRFDTERVRGERVAAIAAQEIGLFAVVGERLVFVSQQLKSDAWQILKDGGRRRLTDDGATADAADCGAAGFLLAKHVNSGIDVVKLSPQGSREVLQTGAWDFSVECSKTSSDWWFTRAQNGAGLFHCQGRSCERIASGDIRWLSLSPDESRIAFVTYDKRGRSVKWIPNRGGPIHDVTDSEGACRPGWSSPSTIWVSRRIRGRLLWTEVDAESGHPTGRTSPSRNDCLDVYFGHVDPLSPVRPEIRIVSETISQIRIKDLPPPPS